MQSKFSTLVEKVHAFEERFTPSIEEYGSSELYFDFENKCRFRPTPQQLRECMGAYADMIGLAASLTQTRDDADEATSQMLYNSELLLGYLERSQPVDILACKDVAQLIADSAKYLLVKADDPFLVAAGQAAQVLGRIGLGLDLGLGRWRDGEQQAKHYEHRRQRAQHGGLQGIRAGSAGIYTRVTWGL